MWSIVIPAYNECARLPNYLKRIRRYYPCGRAYEVVVVDDGSSDGLRKLLNDLFVGWPQLRVISHDQNLGKGAAIRTGILAAQGDVILITDADGAAPIENERRLRQALQAGASIACGSRRVQNPGLKQHRTSVRFVVGRMFNFATWLLVRTDVKDTQCGFKLFRSEVAKHLATVSAENGFALDVELLAMAKQSAYPVAEVAISWHDVRGGKVRLLHDGAEMLLALWRIRRRVQRKFGPQSTGVAYIDQCDMQNG